jgi:hypothetical protein
MDWKNIKSVEEILTERTGIDCRLQVAIRCDQQFDEGVLHRQLSAWPLNFVARFSTADPMVEVISLTFLAPTMNTWAPS